MLAVEQIIIPAYPAVGRWMPGGTLTLLQLGSAVDSDGKLLSAAMGRLVLVRYVAVVVALALLITPRRDVLGLFCSDMRSGLWLPLFEELADPRVVARLAADAEERGWHGVGGVCGHLWRASDVWIVSSGI